MFTFCSSLPPVFRPLSVCLTGECVERLPVWMLLLSSILAPDLQRAEEKSSNPRLFLLLSQIHCSDLPAGGALGLDTCNTSFSLPLLQPALQSTGVDLITLPLFCSHSLLPQRIQQGHNESHRKERSL